MWLQTESLDKVQPPTHTLLSLRRISSFGCLRSLQQTPPPTRAARPDESAAERLATRRRRTREEMEDRGGEGGRDHEDASPKGLAPLWSQSNEERRALRSEYANVRAMIRDGTCAPPRLFSATEVGGRVCDFLCSRVCDCRGEGRPYPPPVRRRLEQD